MALKGEPTLNLGSRISGFSLVSDHAAVTPPPEAVVIPLGISDLPTSLDVSIKGVIPAAWGESLSRSDRGVDKSGIVSTSGMSRRVLRKRIMLAKPSKRQRCQMWRSGTSPGGNKSVG